VTTSRLLRNNRDTVLPLSLFADLQMDKIFSKVAISILRHPCDADTIRQRQELFTSLANPSVRKRVRDCLNALTDYRTVIQLWNESQIPYEKLHLRRRVLTEYANCVDLLVGLGDCGVLFADAASFWNAPPRRQVREELRRDLLAVDIHLAVTHRFLLSLSDKNWITPDGGTDEYDEIAACVAQMGFTVPEKRRSKTAVDASLGDALCRLFAADMDAAAEILTRYDGVDLWEPTSDIPELDFFLEICALTERAAAQNIPTAFPVLADRPRYAAKDLYDITLLAKDVDRIVPSDACFTEEEPFFFLTGANGGGKTTYLRAAGVNLILFLAGCPVFAASAEMYPYDRVLAHFPANERFDGVGRLDEERCRMEEMLAVAKGGTAFFLLNETFSGTDDVRGYALLLETVRRVREAGHDGLCVTHFHEVEEAEFPLLSACVAPEDENRRTYKIIVAKGRQSSYAADILKKYGLDEQSLTERRLTYDGQSSVS